VNLERYRRWALAIGIAASAVLFLAPVSNPVPAVEGIETDKLAHALLVGALAGLIRWNLPAGRRQAVVAVLLAGTYAGLIELIQGMLAFRSGDVMDLLAGVLGAGVFVAAVALVTKRRGARATKRT
jgi:VanZ family protein